MSISRAEMEKRILMKAALGIYVLATTVTSYLYGMSQIFPENRASRIAEYRLDCINEMSKPDSELREQSQQLFRDLNSEVSREDRRKYLRMLADSCALDKLVDRAKREER